MLPLDSTIRDSASVQRLYDAALALPDVPDGIYDCPADFGTSYRLEFLRGTSEERQMVLDPDGCRFLAIGPEERRMVLDPDGCRFLTIGAESSERVTRRMSDAFLTLFMQTAKISSL
jgi:hypothetical protein